MSNFAFALVTSDNRFFAYVKKGRLCTAWTLAGAALFQPTVPEPRLRAEAELQKRGRKYSVRRVGLEAANV